MRDVLKRLPFVNDKLSAHMDCNAGSDDNTAVVVEDAVVAVDVGIPAMLQDIADIAGTVACIAGLLLLLLLLLLQRSCYMLM